MYKLGLKFLSLFAVVALLNTGSSAACGDGESLEFKKGDFSSKRSEALVVEADESKVVDVMVYNTSNDYRLGVRLTDNVGETRMNTQLMPGTSLAFTEYLTEGTYFVTLYNPYWEHAGPEGFANVSLKDAENGDDGDEGSEGGSGSEGSEGSDTESGEGSGSETKSETKADESTPGTKAPEVEGAK